MRVERILPNLRMSADAQKELSDAKFARVATSQGIYTNYDSPATESRDIRTRLINLQAG
jgi:hypothetical protein